LLVGSTAASPSFERRFCEIEANDTLRSLSRRIFDGSVDMLLAAVERAEAGQTGGSLETLGDIYTLPNVRQCLIVQFRVAARRAMRGSVFGAFRRWMARSKRCSADEAPMG
jgi:hypothetical protein